MAMPGVFHDARSPSSQVSSCAEAGRVIIRDAMTAKAPRAVTTDAGMDVSFPSDKEPAGMPKHRVATITV
jgi:hypothetical protein